MIVDGNRIPAVQGRVAMVSGAFDPLHPGHVKYFRAARELGLPLLCNVSSDEYLSGKHAPVLLQRERAAVIDALQPIAYTHLATGTTADALERIRPRVFVKGFDWQGRLPAEEIEVCEQYGIEVAYVDTVTNSSSEIVRRFVAAHGSR